MQQAIRGRPVPRLDHRQNLAVALQVRLVEAARIGYRVEVTNNGDQTTHNVALSYTPPTGVGFLNSTSPHTYTERLRSFRQGLSEAGFLAAK